VAALESSTYKRALWEGCLSLRFPLRHQPTALYNELHHHSPTSLHSHAAHGPQVEAVETDGTGRGGGGMEQGPLVVLERGDAFSLVSGGRHEELFRPWSGGGDVKKQREGLALRRCQVTRLAIALEPSTPNPQPSTLNSQHQSSRFPNSDRQAHSCHARLDSRNTRSFNARA
jgi:hypothetical protein